MGFFNFGNFGKKKSIFTEVKADGAELNQDDQEQTPDYTTDEDEAPDNTPAEEPETDYTQDDTEPPADNPPATTDTGDGETQDAAPQEAPGGEGDQGGEEEPQTTDYTQDDTTPPADDAGDQTNYDLPDTAGDDAAGEPQETDYTQDDTGDGGTETGGEDTGTATDGGEEDQGTDYTQDDTGATGDDATGDTGGEDQGTDYTQDDGGGEDGTADTGEDAGGGEDAQAQDDTEGDANQPVGRSQELKELEAKLFSNLSQEQISIKNTELRLQYTDLYESITKIETRIDNLSKTEANLSTLDFVAKKLAELKTYVNDYIIKTFETNSYLENQINLKSFLVVLETINKILESLKTPDDKK